MRFEIIVILCQGDKVIYVVRKTLSIDIKEKKLDMKAEILKKDDLFYSIVDLGWQKKNLSHKKNID